MTVGEVPGTPAGVDVVTTASPLPDNPPPAESAPARPGWSVGLTTLRNAGPAFPVALRGYNQIDVDNYVAWAETELLAARRLTTELIERLTSTETQLHRAEARLAQSERGRDLARVSERVAEILRLAADEADATRRAGVLEAEEIVADANAEADLVQRRALKLEAAAAARLQDAERRQAEAASAVERARAEAAELLEQAAVERRRLDEQAAQTRAQADAAAARQRAAQERQSRLACESAKTAAAARVAEAEQHLQTLLAQQEAARRHLRHLADQVGTALRLLDDESAPAFSFDGNRATSAERTVVPIATRTTYPMVLVDPRAATSA